MNWSLRRPWILCIQTGKFASVPSTSPMDYVGARMRSCKKKYAFGCRTATQSLPSNPSVPTGVIREIIEHSALALPLLCGQNFSLNRPEIRLDAGNAYALDIKQAEVVKRSIWQNLLGHRFFRSIHPGQKETGQTCPSLC